VGSSAKNAERKLMTMHATSRPVNSPLRGDIWLVRLEPIVGHEQGGTRPAVVVSADQFNRSLAGLVIVTPLTTVRKGIPWHIEVNSPDGGVRQTSYIKCEDIRSISTERLVTRWGTLSAQTMSSVANTIKVLLQL
jgi:mRNA interferase MazF